jgi:mannan polymerase II complex ANP1 subunit
MAKRLKFSVVGLPHYTIWHLYEPSVDDLKHMEEIEKEKTEKEAKEKKEKAQLELMKNQFEDTKGDWEKEKEKIKALEKTEGEIKVKVEEPAGPERADAQQAAKVEVPVAAAVKKEASS